LEYTASDYQWLFLDLSLVLTANPGRRSPVLVLVLPAIPKPLLLHVAVSLFLLSTLDYRFVEEFSVYVPFL